MTASNAGSAWMADTVPARALCRLSPSGAFIARMTSRAGMRTRTVVPTGRYVRARGRSIGGHESREQRAAVERELQKSAVLDNVRDRCVKHAAEPDRLAEPRQVGTTRQCGERPVRDASTFFQDQGVRREPHNVFEVVGDEDERHVERSAQIVDFVLEMPSDAAIDSRKRFVEQQHRRFAGQGTRKRNPLALPA